MASVFGMLLPAGDAAAAISKNDVSASTAAALNQTTDVFFVGAELAAILLTLATALVAFRTGLLPRWWAVFGVLLAVVLVIGPIGWAGLIFGVPVWTLGTAAFLTRDGAGRRARTAAPAAV